MFTVNAIHKELGGRQVLGGISFAVNRGEVIGVVGPNGSGKTTLLRIIAGLLQPDSGRVQTEPGATIAYLPQGVSYAADRSVGEAFPRIFASADDDSLGALAADLAANATPEAEAAYAHALEQLEVAGRWDAHALREELGIATVSGDALTRTLSGGELTKLGLIDAVVATPSILLLDEPTNHLDLGGMEWLERHLRDFRGAAVVVSHDRALLDACATAILELDPRSGTAEMFAGNYAAYAAEKARREEEHWRRYELQQREERQLKRAISSIESRARGIENRTIDFYFRKRAAKTARRAVTLKARLERQHAGKDHVDRPEKPAAGFYSSFQAADSGAARVLTVEHLNLEAGGRHLQRDLSFVVGRKQCVVVAGPNGCGKTTLLRTILGELPASAGRVSLNPSVKVGYLAQHAGGADNGPDALLTPVEALRRESKLSETDAYNFLHRFVMGHDQLRTPMGRLSYGERRRIALARLIAGGAAFLLLDEPTNHLDLPSQEAFDTAFGSFDGASLVVTHDRYFIERFADRVLELPSPPR